MTHSCKAVLNHLRVLSENEHQIFTFVSDAPFICLFYDLNKYYDYSEYAGEIVAIIKELDRAKYLELDSNGVTFSLTYKGLHPCAFAWDELRTFLFRSVFVPIGVSIVTTLATLLLQSLL